VQNNVVVDINSDVLWSTILKDGTKDKNNRENIALAM